MMKREKEFNESADAAVVIQNQMNDCESVEELRNTFDGWLELVGNLYLRKMGEMSGKAESGKSVLMIDTPKNCRECPCHFTDMVTFCPKEGEKFFMNLCGASNKELSVDEMNKARPEWCRLKEIIRLAENSEK